MSEENLVPTNVRLATEDIAGLDALVEMAKITAPPELVRFVTRSSVIRGLIQEAVAAKVKRPAKVA